jgi:TnpA family transposase
MTRQYLLTNDERHQLFGVPLDRASLAKHYMLSQEDRALVEEKRGDANRLGFAIQLLLLRHPGFGYRYDESLPAELVQYISEQLGIGSEAIARYASRSKTRLEHGWLAANALNLRTFEGTDLAKALNLAKEAAYSTDKGLPIAKAIVEGLRSLGIILPAPARIERIGVAGRAQARKLATNTIVNALNEQQIAAFDALLVVNSKTGVTPLAWLRDVGDSPSAKSLSGILERLAFVRKIGLSVNVGSAIHETRFQQLVREGAVAPAFLLSDYSSQRRRATLVASVINLQSSLADAAIAMFSKLTASLFSKARSSQKRRLDATSKDVGRYMRMFGITIGALQVARNADTDPWDTLDAAVDWHKLLRVEPEVNAIADLTEEDTLVRAADKYMTLRRFAPAFIEAFSFKALGARDPVLKATLIIAKLNVSGKREVPVESPLPFSKKWKDAILKDGGINRKLYETATMACLRDRLESGDIWVEGTRDHLQFAAYLLNEEAASKIKHQLPFQTDAHAYLEARTKLLDWRLRRFAGSLKRNSLEGVEIRGTKLYVAPLSASTPPAADQLDAKIDAMLPQVRITELLAEVARHTGFLDSFAELRSGRTHPNPPALLAAILGDATNLGVERMANASQGVTYAQIAWTHGWYLREENYAAALAKITNAQRALPLSKIWGEGITSSSDGQFFKSGRRGSPGSVNARYGNEPGQKIYTHVSDQYAPFHNKLISATAGEAPYVLDGLLSHGTDLEIATHYTDTGGSSDHVFALSHLLGFRFVPRLRDISDRKIGFFAGSAPSEALSALVGRSFNTAAIHQSWDDVVRLAASVKAGIVLPSTMLKKLGAHRRQNRLDFALQEVGRIERTFFTLDWLESKQLRHKCQAGLNKGESRHSLAQAIFAHKQGRLRDRTFDNQALKASGLNLVTAAIVYWNTLYIGKAVDHLRAEGIAAPDELLAHVAPLGWRHISLTGDFLWQEASAGIGPTGFRTLELSRDLKATAA